MAAAGGKFSALVRQGFNEIPELMFGGIATTLMASAACVKVYYWKKNELYNHRYKLEPILMRPDDPRVAKIHKD